MAKEEAKKVEGPIENPTPKKGPLDLRKKVKITATKDAPYHEEGVEYEVSPLVAEKMKANKWAK